MQLSVPRQIYHDPFGFVAEPAASFERLNLFPLSCNNQKYVDGMNLLKSYRD